MAADNSFGLFFSAKWEMVEHVSMEMIPSDSDDPLSRGKSEASAGEPGDTKQSPSRKIQACDASSCLSFSLCVPSLGKWQHTLIT